MAKTKESESVDRSVTAAERTLALLDAFIGTGRELSLGELEERTGLFKSVILRYMISFERWGYATKTGNGVFRLGPRAFQLGRAFERALNISEIIQPVLNSITQQTTETSSVYIRDGDWRVCWLRAESSHMIRVGILPGNRLPMDQTATSRILRRFSEEPIHDIDELTIDVIEHSTGIGDPLLASVAAPLFGANNEFLGSLTLSGINNRFDPYRRDFHQLMLDQALTISRALGATNSREGGRLE